MTFYELEKKCKKRRFIKYLVFLSIFFVLLGSVLIIYLNITKPIKEKKIIKKVSLQKKELKKTEVKKTELQTPQIVLLPYIDLNITDKKVSKTKEIKKIKKENNTSVILKTQNLPSFETCISIAKKYLERKDYKNALKWAKNANIQNKKNPLSWIISAKALYNMGKKKEAVKLLKIYNSYYNNKEVKKLLKEYNEE